MGKIAFERIGWAVLTVGSGLLLGWISCYFATPCLPVPRVIQTTELSARASYLRTKQKVASAVAPHIERMIADAEQDGMCLVVMGGFRTRETQRRLYDEAKDKSFVAYPGTSEHETGLAVDLVGCPMSHGVRDDGAERPELAGDFDSLPEYRWLTIHASDYGFRQSYTEINKAATGFPAEPWHWRYFLSEPTK